MVPFAVSVALSTLRGVLDPERHFDADRFVVSSAGAVSLDLDHVAVDLEAFLGEAAAGLALHDDGRAAQAHARLSAAEAAYAGDLLEEDLYEDWAVAAREQARDMYVRVARRLAGHAHAAGDHDGAVRFLLRVLERDGYDEEAHLALVHALVDAGRHGEARRPSASTAGAWTRSGSSPPRSRPPRLFKTVRTRDGHDRRRWRRSSSASGSRPSRTSSGPARRCKGSRSTSAPAWPPRSPKASSSAPGWGPWPAEQRGWASARTRPRGRFLRGVRTGAGVGDDPGPPVALAGGHAPTVVSSRQWNWPTGSSKTSLPP